MTSKLLTIMAAAVLVTGCRTTNGEFDPVTTEQVKAAVQPLIGTAITVILTKERKDKAQEVGAYFRGIGRVFCAMKNTGHFEPDFLIVELDKVFNEHVQGDILVLSVKNTAVALYRAFYATKNRAELPETEWPFHVASLMCDSIGQGLVDAGQEGITPL